MEPSRRRSRVSSATSLLLVVGALMASFLSGVANGSSFSMVMGSHYGKSQTDNFLSATHRKLLLHDHKAMAEVQQGRSDNPLVKCVKDDIEIDQGTTGPLPSGIPKFTVEITNACFTGCNISNIHLKCGWFSSDLPIDPLLFRRVAYDDCLVNDGKPLANGGVVSFEYATSLQVPLSVSSILC